MLKVLVADDDPDYRLLVRLAVEHTPDVSLVGEAADSHTLCGLVAQEQPDVLLLDASMYDAIATARRLHDTFPQCRIVLTSSLPARLIAHSIAAAGAVGSLAKDIPIRHVPDAIREINALAVVAERALRTVRTGLENDLTSPRLARQLARTTLSGWCDDDVLSSLELLISELVANGVEHADSAVDVRIAVGTTSVRVEVSDQSASMPVLRSPALDSPNGRGMLIVDNAAARWGVLARRTGKCVWFELPRLADAVQA
jgi:DNA-binding NarL/FixJ family response regulator